MSSSQTRKRPRKKQPVLNVPGSQTVEFSFEDLLPSTEPTSVDNFVDHVSVDLRRVYREQMPLEPPSPLKRAAKRTRREELVRMDVDVDLDDRYCMGGLDDTEVQSSEPLGSTPPSLPKVKPAVRSWLLWLPRLNVRLSGPRHEDLDGVPPRLIFTRSFVARGAWG